jgi:hypothetical protein
MGIQSPISPIETKFKFKKKSVYNVVQFLFYIQERKGFEPKRPIKSYLREASKFVNKYGIDRTIELIKEANLICEYPFFFTFLEKLAEEER